MNSGRLTVSGQRFDYVVEFEHHVSIGRSSRNDIPIKDTAASRHHAEVRRLAPGRFVLIDLGSRNGTYVDGTRASGVVALKNGSQIRIGTTTIDFEALEEGALTEDKSAISSVHTLADFEPGTVVVLMSDVWNYSRLTAALPSAEFQGFIADWFGDVIRIVKEHGGTVDKIIGDAIMVYWFASASAAPTEEVELALLAAREIVEQLGDSAPRFAQCFPGHEFRVGIGLNAGPASLGNLGTGTHQAFTVVGDCVNMTARLEALTRRFDRAVLTTEDLAAHAPEDARFEHLGSAQVQGRSEPLPVLALEL